MARSYSITLPGGDERLIAFSRRLSRLVLEKGWNGSDLAREMTKRAPKGVKVGRHLTTAWMRGDNEPSVKFLKLLGEVMGKSPDELLPPRSAHDERKNFATVTTTLATLDGMSRLVIDANVPADVAQEIMSMVRKAEKGSKKHS